MVSAMPSSRKSPSSVKPNHSQVKDPLSVKATERVRRRAYELYELRGSSDGLALDDWLQAEAELRVEREAIAA